jgi:hypothetical protein
MIADLSTLKAALLALLRAKGVECVEDCIKVSPLARDRAPTSYLVTPVGTRAQRLAGILAHLTGRLILSDQPAWVLFQHEAQFLVTYMGISHDTGSPLVH